MSWIRSDEPTQLETVASSAAVYCERSETRSNAASTVGERPSLSTTYGAMSAARQLARFERFDLQGGAVANAQAACLGSARAAMEGGSFLNGMSLGILSTRQDMRWSNFAAAKSLAAFFTTVRRLAASCSRVGLAAGEKWLSMAGGPSWHPRHGRDSFGSRTVNTDPS